MQAFTLTLIGIVLIVVVVLIIVDEVRTPRPPHTTGGGTLTLVRRIILPDVCVCSVGGGCPATSTKPHGILFTRAASCGNGCIVLP
jgi:hypothetical protein